MAEGKSKLVPATDEASNTKEPNERERPRTVIVFFIFGAITYGLFSLIIAGAQDILVGTYVQTSLVLVADIGPYFFVTVVAPYFMQRISYFARISTAVVSQGAGIVIIAFAERVYWKLIGIGIVSLGFGVGEVTFVALTSFYKEVALNAYSAGTGVGFVFAPFYYTAMTTWLCVSPNTTIMISGIFIFLYFACYYFLEKKHSNSPNPPKSKHDGVTYAALGTSDTEADKSLNEGDKCPKEEPLSCSEKFMVIRQMIPSLIPLFIAWTSEYLIIQSVITTLAFPNAPFRPRDHYQYYIFLFLGGEVIGRSYLVVLRYIRPEWAERAKLPHLWVLSAIEVAHLFFFVFAAWYRFLPNVWIVLVVSFTGGVTIGILYVNALAFFLDSFEDRYKEFAMGYAVVALAGGTFAAALLGLCIEPKLRKHCTMLLKADEYCFTRSKAIENITSRCLVKN